MTTTSKTLYFYKGTTFPVIVGGNEFPKKIENFSVEMIITGMKQGVSREQQIKDYTYQLNIVEQTMCDIQRDFGEPITDADTTKGLTELCKRMGQTQDYLMTMWCLNISALLVMKALKQDDFNGTMRQVFIDP